VRITHWVNALVLLVLLMSGLQIFNAHPALYLGEKSDFANPILAMGTVEEDTGSRRASPRSSATPFPHTACSA
jgi:hypothetical protein